MNQFFDIEGKFFRRLDKLADIMILNILFVITSIPIITIGPSLAAMYYVLFKIREDKEGNIVKTYFREFRSNLKIGTICWLIMLILAVLLYWDLIIIKAYTGTIERVLRVIVYLLIVLWVMIYIYVFPFISRFENTIRMHFKNALFLSLANLKSTIAMFIMTVAPVIITFKSERTLWIGIILWLMIGFALIAWFHTHYLMIAFKPFLPEEENRKDEE